MPTSLEDYVESIFYFKGFQPDHSIERVVPTGHLFIIFELDGIERNTFDNQTLAVNETFRNVWVSGMHKNYLSISAHQDSEMFVIQFKPAGAFPFFHIPIHRLNNTVILAQEIFGDEIVTLRKQILKSETVVTKFDIATQWLLDRFDTTKIPEAALILILKQLQENSLSTHTTIVKTYSKTQKHLISQFKKYCGLTPKVLHRIFRFNQMLQQIQAQQKITWSQIAYQFGYTDQSHFIKEFNEFSGFNPQEFIEADHHNSEPNFFPLDRQG
ncbi:helix-turn-helix domain-containing protein [Aquimarina gracilis]|uniref:Helix-turn-helix domain-containing protein n=1 Tax=Aquimarina gracilis TaxID=874422 RepID=A0ABU5ZUR3_9FLAO|nr:helix-turn-helix domain-containing protein [Aquimarina gracilis]MEB3345743.1 helix-turn-helix domain-containing protein [Aquimarina gracilis]